MVEEKTFWAAAWTATFPWTIAKGTDSQVQKTGTAVTRPG